MDGIKMLFKILLGIARGQYLLDLSAVGENFIISLKLWYKIIFSESK